MYQEEQDQPTNKKAEIIKELKEASANLRKYREAQEDLIKTVKQDSRATKAMQEKLEKIIHDNDEQFPDQSNLSKSQ